VGSAGPQPETGASAPKLALILDSVGNKYLATFSRFLVYNLTKCKEFVIKHVGDLIAEGSLTA